MAMLSGSFISVRRTAAISVSPHPVLSHPRSYAVPTPLGSVSNNAGIEGKTHSQPEPSCEHRSVDYRVAEHVGTKNDERGPDSCGETVMVGSIAMEGSPGRSEEHRSEEHT